MSQETKLHTDLLFVGLTRVPTVLGVPYAAFVVEVIAASLINIVVGNPLYMLLMVPFHGIFYLISTKDPGIFAEILIWFKTSGRCLNKSFWEASSFSPIPTRKWKR